MNSTNNMLVVETETVPFKLEKIEERLSDFLNLKDPRDRFAWEEWKEDFEKMCSAAAEVEIVHRFTAPEVVGAAFDYFKADLNENRARFDLKAARNARRLAKMKLEADLGRYDGRFIDDDDDEQVVAAIGAVVAKTKSAKIRMLQQVVDASLKVAEGSCENGAPPTFPEALGEGIRDFQTDLLEFIQVNGQEGRTLVARVCKDCDFARKVRTIHQCQSASSGWQESLLMSTPEQLPEKPSVIGFAAQASPSLR